MSTIYAGAKPIKRLGHRQFHLLSFLLFYPGWHSIATDPLTRRTLASLKARGVVATNEHGQAKFDQSAIKV